MSLSHSDPEDPRHGGIRLETEPTFLECPVCRVLGWGRPHAVSGLIRLQEAGSILRCPLPKSASCAEPVS